MASQSGDRTRFWPAIEKKHGVPIQHWLDLVGEHAGAKYEDQIALLREGHGFSQAHANAVVMYARGSTTTRRFGTLDDYLKGAPPEAQATMRAIFAAIRERFPDLDIVIAWNQPMLRNDAGYVFGAMLSSKHILLAPWGKGVLQSFEARMAGLDVQKKTVRVPLDWDVDARLLQDMAAARIAQLDA